MVGFRNFGNVSIQDQGTLFLKMEWKRTSKKSTTSMIVAKAAPPCALGKIQMTTLELDGGRHCMQVPATIARLVSRSSYCTEYCPVHYPCDVGCLWISPEFLVLRIRVRVETGNLSA